MSIHLTDYDCMLFPRKKDISKSVVLTHLFILESLQRHLTVSHWMLTEVSVKLHIFE